MSGGARDRRGGALLGHRRGPAGCLLRRAAGDLPQRARRCGGAGRDARRVRLAVQRPRDLLPRAPGLRSRAVALSAGVQHMVRSDLGASGVMFTLDTDSGFRDVVFITAVVGARRDRGAGRGEPGRVLRLQARAARRQARDRAPQARRQGASRWSTPPAGSGRAGHDRRRAAGGPPAFLPQRRRSRGARAPGAPHRGALRLADGHRVGQGRRQRRDLHPAGAPGDRAEPRRPHHSALHAQEPLGGARHRPQHRPAHRRGPRARHPRRERDGPRRSRATCWSPT